MAVEVFATTPGRALLCAGTVSPKDLFDVPVLTSAVMHPGSWDAVFHVAELYRATGVTLPDVRYLTWLPTASRLATRARITTCR